MTAGRNWPGGEAEQGWRLASREQPQRVHDGGREVAISGRGKRAAGLRARSSPSKGANVDRNGPSPGEVRGIPAGDEGAAPANARRCTGGSHLWEGKSDGGWRRGR